MATPAVERAVDKRRICSICLEAFRGRQPKILPCFHTFCSPCLLQLAEKEERQSTQVSVGARRDRSAGEKVPVTLTCPTCVPLPSGGVSQLQANFYLEDDAALDPSPLPCDLCEERQKAAFQCANCVNSFCSRCLDFHNQLCKSPAASLITDSTGSAGTQSVGKESQDLAQSMEDVLKKVAEEEKKLALERRATEQDIYERYNTVLRHAAEARDSSLMSLRDVTQAVSDSLMNTASVARNVLMRVKAKTSEGHLGDPIDEVFTESTRRHFEELLKKADEEALLTYTITDSNTHVLLQSLSDFMSTVVAAAPNVNEDSSVLDAADGNQPSGSLQQAGSSSHPNADLSDSMTSELAKQFQALSARLTQNEKVTAGLQAQNTLLSTDLVALEDRNTKLLDAFSAVQKEMTSLRNELTSQRPNVVHIRDKTCLPSQENDSVHSDHSSAKADSDQIQTNHQILEMDFDKIQTNLKQIQSELDQFKAKQSKVEGDVNQIQVDQNKLKIDHNTLTSEVQTLKTDMKQVEDLCKNEKTAIAGLETRLNQTNVPVAFHATLGVIRLEDAQSRTLACDRVETNVGGGYDGQTGVFTAPVSGIYCFMATSTLGSDDKAKSATILLTKGEEIIGALSEVETQHATGHFAVHVQAGETVKLQRNYTHSRTPKRFHAYWCTSFTGMLLYPDL